MTIKQKSVKSAEERAYAGQNESQDSQALIEKYHNEHGIGTVRKANTADYHVSRQNIFANSSLL
jgi:hypothetical protein